MEDSNCCVRLNLSVAHVPAGHVDCAHVGGHDVVHQGADQGELETPEIDTLRLLVLHLPN